MPHTQNSKESDMYISQLILIFLISLEKQKHFNLLILNRHLHTLSKMYAKGKYLKRRKGLLTGHLNIKTHTLQITVEQLESMADWRDYRLKSAMSKITLCDILSNCLNENSSLQKCGYFFSPSPSFSVTKSFTGRTEFQLRQMR